MGFWKERNTNTDWRAKDVRRYIRKEIHLHGCSCEVRDTHTLDLYIVTRKTRNIYASKTAAYATYNSYTFFDVHAIHMHFSVYILFISFLSCYVQLNGCPATALTQLVKVASRCQRCFWQAAGSTSIHIFKI